MQIKISAGLFISLYTHLIYIFIFYSDISQERARKRQMPVFFLKLRGGIPGPLYSRQSQRCKFTAFTARGCKLEAHTEGWV